MKIECNRVYNCDCLDLMKEMKAQNIVANCLLTDIPYGKVNRNDNGLRNLNKDKADNTTFELNTFLQLADDVISGVFLIFCGTEQVSEI